MKSFDEVEWVSDALADCGTTDASGDIALARAALSRRAAQLLEAQSIPALCAHSRVVVWLLSISDAPAGRSAMTIRTTLEARIRRSLSEIREPKDLHMAAGVIRLAAAEPGLARAASADIRTACERLFARISPLELREDANVRDLIGIARWYPGVRLLLQSRLVALANAISVAPGASAAVAPSIRELLRAVAALVKSGVLDGQELVDGFVSAVTCQLARTLAALDPNDAAHFFFRCTDGNIEELGVKFARALDVLAAHHGVDVSARTLAPSVDAGKASFLPPLSTAPPCGPMAVATSIAVGFNEGARSLGCRSETPEQPFLNRGGSSGKLRSMVQVKSMRSHGAARAPPLCQGRSLA